MAEDWTIIGPDGSVSGKASFLSLVKADLAVAKSHQRSGIGKRLIEETRKVLGPKCMVVLLAAPGANGFYPHIGFTQNPRAWVLAGGEHVRQFAAQPMQRDALPHAPRLSRWTLKI